MPPERRGRRRAVTFATLLLAWLLPVRAAWPQAGLGVPAAAQPPAQPKDALGRETPRRAVLGFIAAARNGNDDVAALYLDTNLKGEAAAELAHQLFVVLDTRLPARLNELSDRPEGSAENPLRPDQNIVGTINAGNGSFDVVVQRITRGTAPPVWLFSRRTLASIPDAYTEIDLVDLNRYLPDIVGKPRVAGIRLWEWLVLLVVMPVYYRLLGSVDWLIGPFMRFWRRRTGAVIGGRVPGLIRLVIMAITIRWVLVTIDLPLLERQFWSTIVTLLLIVAFGWFLLLLTGVGERYLQGHLGRDGETTSLLRLGRRVVDVLVIAACMVATLRYFGFDPTAALAGLGIGGIAVALAAQKTLENVIAGLSLIFDNAVRVGDTLKFGDAVGTVDSIGLRSTRIRTLDRTILTVPNGQIASVGLETLSARDKFWFHHFVGLEYGTTAGQIRAVVDGIQAVLVARPDVDAGSARVRFQRLGASSLDIEVVAYVLSTDGDRFLAIQQDLLLRIMDVIDAAGTAIAIPSQTLHIADGRSPLERGKPS